jgi:hypothetical protein
MFVGNGSSASQISVVFIGEAVSNGSGVTGVTMYPYGLAGGKTGGAVAYGLGFGQSWQTVTDSRSLNVAYYNTTGRPIQVFAALYVVSPSNVYGYVNGNIVASPYVYNTGSDATLSYIVPTGASYSVNGAYATARTWTELR